MLHHCCPCYLLEQQLIDANLCALLGGRTAADDEKPIKKKKEKPVKVEVGTAACSSPIACIIIYEVI